MEALGEFKWVCFLVDEELAGDHTDHIAIWRRWLGIQGGNLVLNLLEWQGGELLNDGLRALDLGRLEGEHGLLALNTHNR